MPTFSAGDIEGKAVLDRAEFIAGLDEISAKADEFSRKKITPLVEIQNIGKVRGQLDQINNRMQKLSKAKANPAVNLRLGTSMTNIDKLSAKLDELSKRNIRPDVDLGGVTATSAQLTALRAQLDRLDKQKTTVRVDTKNSEQGLKRLLDGILALAPALVPLGAATIGGAAGLAGAFTAAGAGVGAFALAAVPAIKKVTAAEAVLGTSVFGRTKAQNKALAGLSKGEQDAAKQMLSLVQTYHGFTKALEPTTFTVLAKGADLAKTGLHDIAPIAESTGKALGGLEDKAKTALDSKFYRTFFTYLAVEAPRSVDTLGRSVGNVGTGFAGLLQTFTPVEHQLEGGLLRLSQRFADFGRTSGANTGLQSFIDYIQREGPQVLHLIGQFATTFADVAKAAAPLGAAELKVVSGLLQFVDAEAKAHPKLVELALGIYTVNKAISALKITALVGSVDKLAGLGGKGLSGIAGTLGKVGAEGAGAAEGAGLLSKAGDKIATKFPGVTKLLSGATGVLGGLGGAFGATGLAATGVGAAALVAAGGIAYLGYKLATAKSTNDTYYDSLVTQYKATGDNVKGYHNLQDAVDRTKKSAQTLANVYGQELQLSTQGGGTASAELNKRLAQTKIRLDEASFAAKKNQHQLNLLNGGIDGVKSAFAKLGPAYKLSTDQAIKLAEANGIKLKGGFDKSTQTGKKNLDILTRLVAQTKLSHDPTARFAADISKAAESSGNAADQITAMNNALEGYQELVTSVATTSAQAGDALAALAKDFTKNTSAADKNGAAQKILSGNLLTAGPQTRKLAEDLGGLSSSFTSNLEAMFKTEVQTKGTGKAFQDVSKAADTNKAALIRQLEAMGLNAAEAKKLADRYASVPKDITTQAHLAHVKDVVADAANITKKIGQIPISHTTKTNAEIHDAESNIATLKEKIKGLPPKAKTTAEAEVKQAEIDLAALKQQIIDLTTKNYQTIKVGIDGSVGSTIGKFGQSHVAAASGRYLNFPGPEGVDSIPAMLAPKEYVVQSKAVHREGVGAFDALNAGRARIVPAYAAGGAVDINAATNGMAAAGSSTSAWLLATVKKIAEQEAASQLPDSGAHGASAAKAQSYARSLLSAFGWGAGQFPSLVSLWNGESGWNSAAQNPSSTAYGIAQFLNSTWAGKRYPKTGNYQEQIYDGFQYIKGSYGSPVAAYSAWSSRSPHWYGGGLDGGVFTKPTLIGVGEKGPERVDVTPIGGYASGGKVAKIPGTSFSSPKLFEQAGAHLLDVILGSLTGNRARTAIQSVDNSIIHSIDTDFTGATRSGLVRYTQRVNTQMLGLATERDRIAQRLSAANELSTSVSAAAKSSADISSFTALGAKNLQKEFNSKLAAINRFGDNIELMKRHGFSSELISELLAAGIDQSAPIAAQLAKAKPAAVHRFNATQRSVDRASKRLGTVAVNAEFGKNAADHFVSRLRSQEHSLERQMALLAKVFAHGVGHAFHIKGYASGGHASGLAVVGERGPELADFGNPGAAIHPNLSIGGDTSRVEALLGVLIDAVNAGHVIKVNEKVLGRVVSQRQKVDAVRGIR